METKKSVNYKPKNFGFSARKIMKKNRNKRMEILTNLSLLKKPENNEKAKKYASLSRLKNKINKRSRNLIFNPEVYRKLQKIIKCKDGIGFQINDKKKKKNQILKKIVFPRNTRDTAKA